MLQVPDLEATVAALRQGGVRFRTSVITGVGTKQVMIEDRREIRSSCSSPSDLRPDSTES